MIHPKVDQREHVKVDHIFVPLLVNQDHPELARKSTHHTLRPTWSVTQYIS